MAYLGGPNDIGNFLKPSVNNKSFPLHRFIKNHPNYLRVFDECRDEEGYLVIHRAVQGGNINAVRWFISLGVDISKKTRSGWTALDLSILYLDLEQCLKLAHVHHYRSGLSVISLFYQDHRHPLHVKVNQYGFENLFENHLLLREEVCYLRKQMFKLLNQFSIKYNGSTSFSWCKPKFTEPSLFMEQYPCTNKHGIKPLYLTYLYEDIGDQLKTNGKVFLQPLDLHLNRGPKRLQELQYPEREAEYHLIYNYLFQTPDVDLNFELDFEGLLKCPGINDMLPNRTVIKRQIEQCYNYCWQSASEVNRTFLSTFSNISNENIFDLFDVGFFDVVVQMSKLRYFAVKMFYEIPSKLWRQISKAYSCSYRCRCIEIMRLLQEQFTSKPRRNGRVSKFVAERMGWNIHTDGDVLYHWPFRFLLKKALKKDKDYEYLKIIAEDHFTN